MQVGDAEITIHDYDVDWPSQFREQKLKLEALLRPWLATDIEHVGSTAVPGLRAKPVIDMLASVHSLSQAESSVAVLSDAGWMFWPEDPNRHYRLWFLRPTPELRTHHLHVIEKNDAHAIAMRAFRDVLRANFELRDEYQTLKERLAESSSSRNSYTNAKLPFIERVLREAGVEPPPRDKLPEN